MAKFIIRAHRWATTEINVLTKGDARAEALTNWKLAQFFVETNDDKFPVFVQFDGTTAIDLFGSVGQNNIVDVDMDESFDGDGYQWFFSDNVSKRDRKFLENDIENGDGEYEERGWTSDSTWIIDGKFDVCDENDNVLTTINTQPQAIAA